MYTFYIDVWTTDLWVMNLQKKMEINKNNVPNVE